MRTYSFNCVGGGGGVVMWGGHSREDYRADNSH